MNRLTLVPMDFTSVSINALQFAIDCFPFDPIEILHVRKFKIQINDPAPLGSYERTLEVWRESLKAFIEKELGWSIWNERVKITCLQGPVIDQILHHAGAIDAYRILMGTRDKFNFFQRWFGSNSVGVVHQCNRPVYLIPRYARGEPFSRALIASDLNLHKDNELQNIITWNRQFGAFLHFIHVSSEPSNSSGLLRQKKIVENLVASAKPPQGFELSIYEDSDITQSLLSKAYSLRVDIMILTACNHDYLKSLLFRSLSKELILRSDIPLLFLPR